MSAFGGKADMTVCGKSLSRSLLGVKRTCRFPLHMSAFDPKRTFTPSTTLGVKTRPEDHNGTLLAPPFPLEDGTTAFQTVLSVAILLPHRYSPIPAGCQVRGRRV